MENSQRNQNRASLLRELEKVINRTNKFWRVSQQTDAYARSKRCYKCYSKIVNKTFFIHRRRSNHFLIRVYGGEALLKKQIMEITGEEARKAYRKVQRYFSEPRYHDVHDCSPYTPSNMPFSWDPIEPRRSWGLNPDA